MESCMSRSLIVILTALGGAACGAPDRQYYDPDAAGGSPGSGGSAAGGRSGGATGKGGASAGGAGTGGIGAGGIGAGGVPAPDGGSGGSVDAGPDQSSPPIVPGRPGMDIVAAGAMISSPNYKLVFSVGEGPGGNAVMRSPNYNLKAGLIGTTQP
jgi:hypothetical protein